MTLKAPRRSRAAQAGFTLVEIAIVLVIIGLLLGGVLKGQELIENGRVKSAANDFNGILAAHNSYFDRYRRVPGDDGPLLTLQGRGGSWGTITVAGNGDGVITAAATDTFSVAAGDGPAYFQHLKAAGFINGHPADAGVAALPPNPWGGRFGIVNALVQGRGAANLLLCTSNVPGKAAQALDTQFDDGLPNTGNMRATDSAAANTPPGVVSAAANYSQDTNYTLCRDML